ncbi:uncharacterized protein LOC130892764 isoform X3 [Diorhabda carinulata]|uniref:uncharacterized protein LOC130892764 isoform X3 n=1 Tax=Diorhabda carinulata TaxID=1163345 RepID=UPI0025A130B3|nr:uncharacterized protein LOC130892764 isoform X3 [Diorhabda carinulata]
MWNEDVCRLCLSNKELVCVFENQKNQVNNLKQIVFVTTGVEEQYANYLRMKRRNYSEILHKKSIKTKIESVHPTVSEVYSSFPDIKLPHNVLSSDICPSVCMELGAVENYFASNNLDMNKSVRMAVKSMRMFEKNNLETKKAPKRQIRENPKIRTKKPKISPDNTPIPTLMDTLQLQPKINAGQGSKTVRDSPETPKNHTEEHPRCEFCKKEFKLQNKRDHEKSCVIKHILTNKTYVRLEIIDLDEESGKKQSIVGRLNHSKSMEKSNGGDLLSIVDRNKSKSMEKSKSGDLLSIVGQNNSKSMEKSKVGDLLSIVDRNKSKGDELLSIFDENYSKSMEKSKVDDSLSIVGQNNSKSMEKSKGDDLISTFDPNKSKGAELSPILDQNNSKSVETPKGGDLLSILCQNNSKSMATSKCNHFLSILGENSSKTIETSKSNDSSSIFDRINSKYIEASKNNDSLSIPNQTKSKSIKTWKDDNLSSIVGEIHSKSIETSKHNDSSLIAGRISSKPTDLSSIVGQKHSKCKKASKDRQNHSKCSEKSEDVDLLCTERIGLSDEEDKSGTSTKTKAVPSSKPNPEPPKKSVIIHSNVAVNLNVESFITSSLVRPDLRITDDNVLNYDKMPANDMEQFKQLLKNNVDNIKILVENRTQIENPDNKTIVKNASGTLARFKGLKSTLYSYRIPVYITNGDFNVEFTETVKNIETSNKFWSDLKPIGLIQSDRHTGIQPAQFLDPKSKSIDDLSSSSSESKSRQIDSENSSDNILTVDSSKSVKTDSNCSEKTYKPVIRVKDISNLR